MSASSILVRMIAATLPGHSRARYHEEWLADLDGAQELGVAPGSIVLGAAARAVSVDRLDPSVTGMSRGALAIRRGRWAAAFLGTALVLGSGVLTGGFPAAMQVVTLLTVLIGTIQVAASLVAALGGRGPRRAVVGLGAVIVCVLFMGVAVFIPVIGLLSIVGGAALLIVFLSLSPNGGANGSLPRGRRILVALPFSLAVLAVGTVGLLHIVVWNPLAKMPGMTLDEIYGAMAAAGEGTGAAFIVVWAGCWVLSALALPVLAALPIADRRVGVRGIATAGLLLVGLTIGGQWIAGFAMGMGMADTFMTSGGDAAPTGMILSWIGQGALIAALFCALPPRRIRPLATRA